MNGTIYVVIATIGEYSDRSEWPVCYFLSEEQARSWVLRAEASARVAEESWRATIEAWEKANPAPAWTEREAYLAWYEVRPTEPRYPLQPLRVRQGDELRYYVSEVPPWVEPAPPDVPQ